MKNIVHLGDCMEAMRDMPDDAYDLAIVDPPYGLPSDSSNGRGKLKDRAFNTGGIDKKWDKKPSPQYFTELIRISKNQIIWGGNYFDLPPTRCVVCWDKMQPWENFSQWEMAWTSFNKPAPIFRFDNRTGNKIHPTQKPVKLYEWLLKKYAKEGDTILDTHVGSGSSRIAAHKMGFDFTGYEIDADYWQAQESRYNKFCSQLTLF